MHREIDDYVKNCARCTLAKMPRQKTHAPMGHLLASRPLEVLAVDYKQLEKAADGRESVLVLTDVFTKFAWTVPARDQKANTTARLLVREWFQRYGVPQRIHSDRSRISRVRLLESCASCTASRSQGLRHTIQRGTGSVKGLT